MNDIAGIPYVAAIFDKDGAALNKQEVKLPGGTTDVIVASHGWNNNQEQAEELYTGLFTNFAAVASEKVQASGLAIFSLLKGCSAMELDPPARRRTPPLAFEFKRLNGGDALDLAGAWIRA